MHWAARDIPAGSWVHERLLEMPAARPLERLPIATAKAPPLPPLEGYTFEGYRNADGSVGSRNILAITTTVQCVAGVVDYAVKRIKEENLGLSVNVSTSIEGAEDCCEYAGIPRHSVGYSLGFEGKTDKMPNSQVMLLSTMCGHGMISHSLAKKMIDFVKENRRTPDQAAATLTRFCSCGVFNPARARRILEDARTKTS